MITMRIASLTLSEREKLIYIIAYHEIIHKDKQTLDLRDQLKEFIQGSFNSEIDVPALFNDMDEFTPQAVKIISKWANFLREDSKA